ncbi:MAG: anti-sigma factor antagonist [Planctomycetota bacterium]|nr:MAG: anti-sigma factor antagonist [Planctomycetota bacterium]
MADEVVRVDRDGSDTVVISPLGDVDMSCSPTLRTTMREQLDARPRRLIVNLDQVGYMDSSGLATLVEAMRTAKRHGTRVVLCGMNEKVRAIFEIARLHQFFTIVESLAEARES